MEDVSARGKAGPGDVRRQLERAREPDTYDLEAGLRRHRELVARGAPPPAWAEGLAARPRLGAGRWFMGLSALMIGAGALWAGQRASTADPAPLAVSPDAGGPVHGARAKPAVKALDVRGVPSVAPLVTVEPAAPDALQPVAPVQAGAIADAPLTADAVGQALPATPQALLAPEQPPPGVPEPSAPGEAALALAEAARSPVAVERAAPRASAASRPRRSVAVAPAPVPEPTLAELARQSVATAESAPSVPASRPAAALTPARAADALPPPAAQAAPRHLVIEAERPGVVAEMQELSRAEALLARDPAQALKLVQASMAEHPQGYLTEERRYVEVLALLGLRRVEEARLLGREFARLHPQSPYRRRVEAAIATALRAQ
jgi:hypothetical protein